MAESSLVVKIGADFSGLDKGIQDATRSVSSFGDVLKGSFLGALGANIASSAFSAFTGSVSEAFTALQEVDKLAGQTAAVIKSTGGAAGVTAEQISALADSLERKTGVEAEAIQRGQNLLLTFTNIRNEAGQGNDIFDQTTAIMTDLGVAMGTDASGAAIQLGKALNDPTAGITALTRVGVSFTDAQKAQIKAMQESGDIMGAQKIILAELNKEFGGSAEAVGKTFAGAMDRARNALGSITEAMLTPAVPVFTAALHKAADAAYAVSDAIASGRLPQLINEAFGPGPKALVIGISSALSITLVGSMRAVGAQAVTMAATYGRSLATMAAANAPLLGAIAAISFAAYPFIKNWEEISGTFSALWGMMRNAAADALNRLGNYSANVWQIISGHFLGAYRSFVASFIGPVSRAFNALFDALPASIRDALGGLSFSMPNFNALPAGVHDAFQKVKEIARTGYYAVEETAKTSINNFKSTWGDLPGFVKGVMNSFSASTVDASKTATAAVTKAGDAAVKAGKASADGHDKAAKAATGHAKAVKQLASDFGSMAKPLFDTILSLGGLSKLLKDKIAFKKAEEEAKAFAKAQADLDAVVTGAIDKVKDLAKQAEYWGETSGIAAKQQDVLKSAIDTLIADGLDPASERVQRLRDLYNELANVPPPPPAPMDSISKAADALGEISGGIGKILEPFGVQIPNFITSAITSMIGLVSGIGAVTTAVGVLGGALLALNAHPILLLITAVVGAGIAIYKFFEGWKRDQEQAAAAQKKAWDEAAAQQFAYEKQIRQTQRALQDSSRAAIKAYDEKGKVSRDLNSEELKQVRELYDQYTAAQQNIIDSAWKSSDERKKAEEEFAAVADELNATWPAAVASALKNGDVEFIEYFEKLGVIARESTTDIATDIGNNLRSGLISAMRTAGREFLSGNLEWMKKLREGIKETVIGGVIDALIQRAAIDKLMPQIDKLAARLASGERGEGINEAIRGIFAEADNIGSVITGALSGVKTALDEFNPEMFNEAYRPIIANANQMMTDALQTGNAEQAGRASLIFQEAQANAYKAGAPVTIAYYGNGKWTKEDAEKLGQMIINNVRSAGVR